MLNFADHSNNNTKFLNNHSTHIESKFRKNCYHPRASKPTKTPPTQKSTLQHKQQFSFLLLNCYRYQQQKPFRQTWANIANSITFSCCIHHRIRIYTGGMNQRFSWGNINFRKPGSALFSLHIILFISKTFHCRKLKNRCDNNRCDVFVT